MFQEQNLTFDEAVRKGSSLYGSREYLPIAEYRAAYGAGKITDEAITLALRHEGGNSPLLREVMLHGSMPQLVSRPSFRQRGYLASMVAVSGIVLEEQIHPILYRVVASYLDQGIAEISLAEHAVDFWQGLRGQLAAVRPFGISAEVAEMVCNLDAEDLVDHCVREILPAGADTEIFLLEILMAARGWSGVIAQIEDRPQSLNYPRDITLLQYVALYLAVLTHRLAEAGFDKKSISTDNPNKAFLAERCPAETETERIFRLWHESLELTFYLESLAVIRVNATQKRSRSAAEKKADFQAIFCIDDRECSLRRHIEELSDRIETFGTPGYFGIDAVYQGPFDAISIKQCPAPVTPKHRIRGIMHGRRKLPVSRIELNLWHRYANKLWLGWFITIFFGAISLIRLALSVHRPSKSFATASAFAAREDQAELIYERHEGEPMNEGYFDGYTVGEMAERVGQVLRQIGLTHAFAPLVVLVGHGSTSTNNPYFAAYDCGACAGRPGFVNARAFALMANRDDVRALLKKSGLDLPVSTRFIGAIHDTARDEILLLDEDDLMAHHSNRLMEIRELFRNALAHNAHERTRRFAIVDFPKDHKNALNEARQRTEMLFEPRPEYNHATNAIAIVGRRSLSEKLFLDRRAFFNSYDPDTDKDGSILDGILAALVPVCGGINLEYLFSRVDNRIYGAGSKLPHNVFALIGVGNGSEGDLRTGLPEQMIEIHDPLRLMILVEQRLEIVRKMLKRSAALMQWIEKEWVKFCVYDHRRKKFLWFNDGIFEEVKPENRNPEIFRDSISAYLKQRDNVALAVLRKDG